MENSAERARSILELQESMTLWLQDEVHTVTEVTLQGVQYWQGSTEFRCEPSSALVAAAHQHTRVLLEVQPALDSDEVLLLRGKLHWVDTERCACCGETRECLALIPDGIILEQGGRQIPISPAAFADPALQLNPGFLERNRKHINESHEEELRVSVSRNAEIAYEAILVAQVATLTASSVELNWICETGPNRQTLPFTRPASTAMEVHEELRRALQ